MKVLNSNNINKLPFHDSDFLGITFSQNDKGKTDIILNIRFYAGEFENISEYSKIIRSNGAASILFEDCYLIKCDFTCNMTQRDSIDYIRFSDESSIPKKFKAKNRLEIVFNSGSKIECIADVISLVKTEKD